MHQDWLLIITCLLSTLALFLLVWIASTLMNLALFRKHNLSEKSRLGHRELKEKTQLLVDQNHTSDEVKRSDR